MNLGVTAIIPEKDIPARTIIKAAERALYRAEEKGRNRVAADGAPQPIIGG